MRCKLWPAHEAKEVGAVQERAQASHTLERTRERCSYLSSSLSSHTHTHCAISGKFESIVELIEDYSYHNVYSSAKHWPVRLTNGSTNLLHHDIHLFFLTNIYTHTYAGSRPLSSFISYAYTHAPHNHCTAFENSHTNT